MTASTPDLAALEAEMRARALEAMPGAWKAQPFPYDDGSEGPRYFIQAGSGNLADDIDREDALHIAASCPDNVIAVLDGKDAEIAKLRDELRAAEEEIDCHSAEEDGWEHDLVQERARADKAEARIAELTVSTGSQSWSVEASSFGKYIKFRMPHQTDVVCVCIDKYGHKPQQVRLPHQIYVDWLIDLMRDNSANTATIIPYRNKNKFSITEREIIARASEAERDGGSDA